MRSEVVFSSTTRAPRHRHTCTPYPVHTVFLSLLFCDRAPALSVNTGTQYSSRVPKYPGTRILCYVPGKL
eukprot:8921-Rhodomonas_salina.1